MMEEVMMQETMRAARTAENPISARATAASGPARLQSCTLHLLCKCLTIAAGDRGEVIAKEDEEDDLKEGGHAVDKVPRG